MEFRSAKEIANYINARSNKTLSKHEEFVGLSVVTMFVEKFGLEAANKLLRECDDFVATQTPQR